MPELNELKHIRLILGMDQREMGVLMGVNEKSAQSAWQRWESGPDKPSARKALEKAKDLFKERMGFEWGALKESALKDLPPAGARKILLQRKGDLGYIGPWPDQEPQRAAAPAGGPYVTEKAFEDVPGRLKRLEQDLEEEKRKVFALQGAIRQLARAAGLSHLEEQIK